MTRKNASCLVISLRIRENENVDVISRVYLSHSWEDQPINNFIIKVR